MTPNSPIRKVLIIEDEPSIRNALYSLLEVVGYEGFTAYSGQHALARIGRESFDAVLVDLRCSTTPTDDVVAKIHAIRPSLVGRVLVITGEVSDPQTMEVIERHCLPHVSRHRLMQDLWEQLSTLLNQAPAPDGVA